MSESAKRPGARDISDLKARLGLKKKPAKRKAPPGMRGGGALPAPPGAEPPKPDISRDPFGALNQAATHQAPVSTGPEIVVIEKGEAVESVEHKRKAVQIAKIAAMIIVPLIVGMAMGQIGTNAKQFNRTINDADKIADELKDTRISLKAYQKAFAGVDDPQLYNKDLTEALAAVKYSGPDYEKVYKSWLYELDADLVRDVLFFVLEANKLKDKIKAHVDITTRDLKNLVAAQKAAKDSKVTDSDGDPLGGAYPYKYAVMVEIPTQEEMEKGSVNFGAQLVELGAPVCDGQVDLTGECRPNASGFRYRTTEDGAWKQLDKASIEIGGSTVPHKTLIPLLSNGATEIFLKGARPSFTELSYAERVAELIKITNQLIGVGTDLEGALKAQAGQGEKFTFFM